MRPVTYTKRGLPAAFDAARYLAFKTGLNTWTVAIETNYDVFENISQEDFPYDRAIKAGVTPGGDEIPIYHGTKPRASLKTYDVYAPTRPPEHIGQVKGQTRAEAHVKAQQGFGVNIRIGVAGDGSAREVTEQMDRANRAAAEMQAKRRRRDARDSKYMERERLEASRKYHRERAAEEEERRIERGKIPTPDETIGEMAREGWESINRTITAGLNPGGQFEDNHPSDDDDEPTRIDPIDPPHGEPAPHLLPAHEPHREEPHQEEEEPPTTPGPDVYCITDDGARWTPGTMHYHVYRPTDDGILWVGGTRLSRTGDPPARRPIARAHALPNGRAIAWQTDREDAQLFASRIIAERYTMAQGWSPGEIRAIPAHLDPDPTDPPAKAPSVKTAPKPKAMRGKQ